MAQKRFKCLVSGDEKYFPPTSLAKKVAKFGTENEFARYYISPKARKLIKSGLTVEEARNALGVTEQLPEIDIEILYKLKLIKLNKRKGTKEAEEAKKRQAYLNSTEFKEKMRAIQKRRENMSFREQVVEMTGGPDGCQIEQGGTCVRPDIYLTHNHKACDGCEYYEFCVCIIKRLSHEKKTRRRKRK